MQKNEPIFQNQNFCFLIVFSMFLEQYQVKKENIYEQLEYNAGDEKIKRESLRKGLNNDGQPGCFSCLTGALVLKISIMRQTLIAI